MLFRLGDTRWIFDGAVATHLGPGARVTDVATVGDETTFVLFGSLGRIVALDRTGTAVAHFGSPGLGPGHFRNPVDLAFDDEHRLLYVLDQAAAKVSVLEWRRTTLSFVRDVAVDEFAQAICVLNGTLFVFDQSPAMRPAIQVYEGGQPVRRFADAFGKDGGGMSQMALRGAVLACDPRRSLVLVASRYTGELRAYSSSNGVLRWSTSPEGFVRLKQTVTDRSVSIDPATPQPWDLVDALFVFGDVIGLQFERAERPPSSPNRRAASRITAFMLVESGAVLSRTDQLPRIATIVSELLITAAERASDTIRAVAWDWNVPRR